MLSKIVINDFYRLSWPLTQPMDTVDVFLMVVTNLITEKLISSLLSAHFQSY